MQLIYEKSRPGRRAVSLPALKGIGRADLDARLRRAEPAELPELPEVEVVRHCTALSRRKFSGDSHFYPLGSCTMKYNPKACEAACALPGLADLHPLWPQLRHGGLLTQGALQILYETERLLSEITGMAECTLQPLAGSHGELTGVMLMAAYHRARGNRKTHIIIPDNAHGTNPASAAIAGYEVVSIPSNPDGTLSIAAFRAAINVETAGVMLTCPSTLGLFVGNVREIAEAVHAVDGLMYYDGANLNAILGRCKPGAMGFDVCHINLHKTFATPHGGGGPGSGTAHFRSTQTRPRASVTLRRSMGISASLFALTPICSCLAARGCARPATWRCLTRIMCRKNCGRTSTPWRPAAVCTSVFSAARASASMAYIRSMSPRV